MLESLQERVNADAWLVHRGRFIRACVLVDTGAAQYLVSIEEGRIAGVLPGPFVMPRWHFALRAAEDTWARFCSALPPPGFHDVVAMLKFKRLRLEGDPTLFMTHLRYFKDMLGTLRETTP